MMRRRRRSSGLLLLNNCDDVAAALLLNNDQQNSNDDRLINPKAFMSFCFAPVTTPRPAPPNATTITSPPHHNPPADRPVYRTKQSTRPPAGRQSQECGQPRIGSSPAESCPMGQNQGCRPIRRQAVAAASCAHDDPSVLSAARQDHRFPRRPLGSDLKAPRRTGSTLRC